MSIFFHSDRGGAIATSLCRSFRRGSHLNQIDTQLRLPYIRISVRYDVVRPDPTANINPYGRKICDQIMYAGLIKRNNPPFEEFKTTPPVDEVHTAIGTPSPPSIHHLVAEVLNRQITRDSATRSDLNTSFTIASLMCERDMTRHISKLKNSDTQDPVLSSPSFLSQITSRGDVSPPSSITPRDTEIVDSLTPLSSVTLSSLSHTSLDESPSSHTTMRPFAYTPAPRYIPPLPVLNEWAVRLFKKISMYNNTSSHNGDEGHTGTPPQPDGSESESGSEVMQGGGSALIEWKERDTILPLPFETSKKEMMMQPKIAYNLLPPKGIHSVPTKLFQGLHIARLNRHEHETGGRGFSGRKGARVGRGGGYKRRWVYMDRLRARYDIWATVIRLEFRDFRRLAYLALLQYDDGVLSYITAPDGLLPGMRVVSSRNAPIAVGNRLPMEEIPKNTIIHELEYRRGLGGAISRSRGSYYTYLGQYQNRHAAVCPLTKQIIKLPLGTWATIGRVSNPESRFKIYGSGGEKRHAGFRPRVRGVKMTPPEHPHAGGHRQGLQGMKPVTYYGLPAMYYKTRAPARPSTQFAGRIKRKIVRQGKDADPMERLEKTLRKKVILSVGEEERRYRINNPWANPKDEVYAMQ